MGHMVLPLEDLTMAGIGPLTLNEDLFFKDMEIFFEHHRSLFSKALSNDNYNCSKCQKIINGWVYYTCHRNNLSQTYIPTYHEDCFNCDACNVPFDTIFYHTPDFKNVYCGKHFYEKFMPRCGYCDKIIYSDKYVVTEDNTYWHVDHFFCQNCHVLLIDKGDENCDTNYVIWETPNRNIYLCFDCSYNINECIDSFQAENGTTLSDQLLKKLKITDQQESNSVLSVGNSCSTDLNKSTGFYYWDNEAIDDLDCISQTHTSIHNLDQGKNSSNSEFDTQTQDASMQFKDGKESHYEYPINANEQSVQEINKQEFDLESETTTSSQTSSSFDILREFRQLKQHSQTVQLDSFKTCVSPCKKLLTDNGSTPSFLVTPSPLNRTKSFKTSLLKRFFTPNSLNNNYVKENFVKNNASRIDKTVSPHLNLLQYYENEVLSESLNSANKVKRLPSKKPNITHHVSKLKSRNQDFEMMSSSFTYLGPPKSSNNSTIVENKNKTNFPALHKIASPPSTLDKILEEYACEESD